MLFIVTLIHIFLAIVIIIAVLLQSGKGTDIASVFGGGGTSSAFGPTGAASLLWKITAVAFGLFLITATTLSIMHTKREMPTPLRGIEKKIPVSPQPPAPLK
jgi:preprotein translocase subunit SecG